MSEVDEVKLKTDLVSLVGEHVDLKKAGKNYKGLCPFHNEKTPSFIVTPELQIYKCFGCGASGDVFTFLEEYEGMEFYEALKFLAEKTGVKLKPRNLSQETDREKLLKINALAAEFYKYILHKHKAGEGALRYLLDDRGLKKETIELFSLGYSPDVPFALKQFLVDRKKVGLKDLEQAGIVYVRGGSAVDRFRGRVIFPLHDHRGNVVGFAGRIMPGRNKDLAKYINTPETSVYHKSHILFGLNKAKDYIRKNKEVIVVEGELDMISCWQVGIKNTVAIKGSALTEEQTRLIGRFANKVVLALDADIAGDMAARRGINIAEKAGLEVRVLLPGKYKDPDEAARYDPQSLKESIEKAVNVWDFIINSVFSKHDAKSGSGKAKISKEIIPVLASITDSIVRAHYISLVSKRLNVPADAVDEQIKSVATTKKPPAVQLNTKPAERKQRHELLEEELLAISLSNFPEKLVESEVSDFFTQPINKKIVSELASYLKENDKFDAAGFLNYIKEELREHYRDIVLKGGEYSGLRSWDETVREFELIKREFKELILRKRLQELVKEIEVLEDNKEKKKLHKKQEEFTSLIKALRELEGRSQKSIIL